MSLSRDRTRSQFRRSRADAGRHLSCRSRSALQCRSRSRLGSQTLRSTRREPGGSRRQPGSAQTSFRPGVGGLVDLTHAARAEGGVDLVGAEGGAGGEGHGSIHRDTLSDQRDVFRTRTLRSLALIEGHGLTFPEVAELHAVTGGLAAPRTTRPMPPYCWTCCANIATSSGPGTRIRSPRASSSCSASTAASSSICGAASRTGSPACSSSIFPRPSTGSGPSTHGKPATFCASGRHWPPSSGPAPPRSGGSISSTTAAARR